jgi:hypothetical protein
VLERERELQPWPLQVHLGRHLDQVRAACASTHRPRGRRLLQLWDS